ncbi:2-hydroxyacid dehydrogenase [Alkalibacter saccharofermentans]|uniref:Glyoxylate/hydroxypyruvate reductase B n=1 Tax=Alkalibacter saccharofermentans DSM 14828 TaxID=1120975 RepID=A0A1M4WGB0_9FIRM|nr:D-glycerate dehydrogenase [Alkalibacter saccharofermentans]SHE80190.1 gluconate 2-dehydrogenase [Alkalibacter saccharofermentans DSM 14828]
MKNHKVFIAKKIPTEVEKYIASHCEYEMWDKDEKIPQEILYEKISDVDGVMLSQVRVDGRFFDYAPKLKVVSAISAGYDNFDTKEIIKRGILATHTPKVLDDTVADLVMGLVLSTARRIPELDRYVRENRWKSSDATTLFGKDVSHAVLGIVGMGNIGRSVAKRAKFGFDMEVIYHNRKRNAEAEREIGAVYAEFEELLGKSDFVAVMTPVNESTRKMFNKGVFEKMKDSAILINASRGEVVDEDDLAEALTNGLIAGAGLDVYEKEPIGRNNPLLGMKNVVLLPHIGSATQSTRSKMAEIAAESMIKSLNGEACEYLIPELKNAKLTCEK